jgi:uncharacterized protein (DUF58 family)
VSPAPRAAVLLGLIAAAALVLPLGMEALLAVALAAAVAVDAGAARRAPEVRRQVPEVLSRGVPGELRLRATAPPGGGLRLRQPAPPELAVAPREGEGALDAGVVARVRGRHVLPAVAARVTGPLGLARWDHAAGGTAEVRVFPDLRTARRLALAVARGRFRDTGATARGPLGLGTEFELVRDYEPDDDFRQVNWRATARLGRPMNNQYRLEQDRDLTLLIDAGRLSAAPLRGRDDRIVTVLDAVLDAAAALAFVADELGDRCGAIAFDDGVRVALPPRRAGGAAVVRALFDLQPKPVDSDYELAFRRAEGAKRALVVVLCDLLEEAAARPLVAAVPVLTRRHAVIVAFPSDPALEALAQAPAAPTPLDSARAVVAGDVLAARGRAARQVRAAGARVLEAPPGDLAAAVVAAYLRAKARAVL